MADLTLPGIVEKAAPGLRGIDSDSPIDQQAAAAIKAAGYSFAGRYIPHDKSDKYDNNLTNAEALTILNAGLALIVVQHPREKGWDPTGLGATDGQGAADYAKNTVGLPSGVNVWCDLEGVAGGIPAADVIAYCQDWFTAVNAAGYVPGLYVGSGCGLTPQELYDLSFQHYWQGGRLQEVLERGFQLIQYEFDQTFSIDAASGATLGIDIDRTQNDNMGDALLWLAPVPVV